MHSLKMRLNQHAWPHLTFRHNNNEVSSLEKTKEKEKEKKKTTQPTILSAKHSAPFALTPLQNHISTQTYYHDNLKTYLVSHLLQVQQNLHNG